MKMKCIVLTVLISILFFSVVPGYARMFGNGGEATFTDGSSTIRMEGTWQTSDSMADLIIKGADFYLLANANITLLSEKIEVSGIYSTDSLSMNKLVNSAIENMKKAHYNYKLLEFKANQTPYNESVIAKLMVFDYSSFQEQNSLLKDVFSEVKNYMVKGDVRGIYSHTLAYFDIIIGLLEDIKAELETGKIPANNLMWNLNQVCVKTHMFGQYIAMIFEAIK